MTDPATLRPGDTVLVRAIVDRAPVGSSISVHVGNGTALVVPADIAQVEHRPRRFLYTSAQIEAPLILLAEHGDRLWLSTGVGEPITVPRGWVKEVTPEADTG